MIPGDLGARAIQSSVRVQQFGGTAPLGGATVTCYHHSYVRPSECPNAVATAADGSFSFGEMYLHDTDRIDVSVAVAGYGHNSPNDARPHSQKIQAYRHWTYRIGRPIKTKEQAVDFVNERGFIYFWPSRT